MAQTTEPRTFEEYNFQEFLKTKKENDALKNENKQLQDDCDVIAQKYQDLLDLVKVAFSNARVEEDIYTNVYINGNFVGLFDKEDERDMKNNLVALSRLINKVQAIPSRVE